MPDEPARPPPQLPAPVTSPWVPLRHATFRMMWFAWVAANLSMWMNDVASAWLMTSLTSSPIMVALVQSAATLPVFLFGVASGALADILDRRNYFVFTQLWVAGVALVLCLTAATDTLNAPLLLALTFANGIGLAMRWPLYAAILPDLVPRAEVPAAVALNGVAMNTSRIVGPTLAGAMIAALGTAWVFALNAVVAVVIAIGLMRWRREPDKSTLPSERFFGAIRVGLQHVRQAPHLQTILLRIAVFFMQSMALMALLPLVATRIEQGGARTYTLLVAAMGAGAVCTVLYLPRLRTKMSRDAIVRNGTLLHAAATVGAALAPNVYVALLTMVAAGVAWISVANTLTVAAQLTLPNWVRARGMAIYQVALMGGSALGAALWGQVATLTSVRTSLIASSVVAVLALYVLRRFSLHSGSLEEADLAPRIWHAPELAIPIEPEQGPVLVTSEYRIDPARAEEFVAVMRESRRIWLSNGLLAWHLFHDTSDPGCYIEHFIDESWAEYLRRNERVAASYHALRETKLSFHVGDGPPAVRRFVAEPVTGRSPLHPRGDHA